MDFESKDRQLRNINEVPNTKSLMEKEEEGHE
jgi:hypothetical protein